MIRILSLYIAQFSNKRSYQSRYWNKGIMLYSTLLPVIHSITTVYIEIAALYFRA
jgi:hypothetical protein